MLKIMSIARKKQPSFKEIYPLKYKKEIFSKLKTCYFLNATQKGLYQILIWGINKNKIQNGILSTQISSVVLRELLKKRKKDPRKKYSASTISKMIKVLKDHGMIKSIRGKDKINRYYALHPKGWITNEKENESQIEKENRETYNLFSGDKNLIKTITNTNIKIKRERIKQAIEKKGQEREIKTSGEMEQKAEKYLEFLKRKGIKIVNETAYKIKILREGDQWDYSPMEKEQAKEQAIEKEEEKGKIWRNRKTDKKTEAEQKEESRLREEKERKLKENYHKQKKKYQLEKKRLEKEKKKEALFSEKLTKFKEKEPSFFRKIEKEVYKRYCHINKNILKRYLKNYMIKIIEEDGIKLKE